MTQSWAPAPQAQPLIKKPRRWLWIAGLLAALSAGVAVGAVIGLGQVPADDNPKVLAALNEVADVRAAADQQAAQREEEVRVQADALDAREGEIDEREQALDEREDALDKRKASLDKRDAGLKKREKSIKSQEREVAANTVPGDGVFVVGEDIKPGTYKTSGPSADGIGSCYYAFKNGTGSDADIVDNNIVEGQATVSLSAGQIFETTSCSDWTRQ